VADANKCFISASIGKPGTINDSIVLQMSDLWLKRHSLIPFPYWLAGDKGYVLSIYLITPFKLPGPGQPDLGPHHHQFNKRLSQTRVMIEDAWGILTARFHGLFDRRRYKCPVTHMLAIGVSMILHSLCRDAKIELMDDDLLVLAHLHLFHAAHMARRDLEAVAAAVGAWAVEPGVGLSDLEKGKMRRAEVMGGVGIQPAW
jgi:hypothetical protein